MKRRILYAVLGLASLLSVAGAGYYGYPVAGWFDSLTVAGAPVWHGGNLVPTRIYGVNCTFANGAPTGWSITTSGSDCKITHNYGAFTYYPVVTSNNSNDAVINTFQPNYFSVRCHDAAGTTVGCGYVFMQVAFE